MDLIDCPVCGLPADVIDRFTLDSTGGPVPHLRTRCLAGHALTYPQG